MAEAGGRTKSLIFAPLLMLEGGLKVDCALRGIVQPTPITLSMSRFVCRDADEVSPHPVDAYGSIEGSIRDHDA